LPEQAVRMYLADPQIRAMMKKNRWPREASAYVR
jgi:hypothetical protein